MAEGWIKIYRNIQEHWLWNCEPFSRGQAWIDLLLMANHKENKVMINGNLIVIKTGERVTSIRKLSERWKWSTCKVKHFLKQLESDKMIECLSDTSKTVIKIVNYEKYQENNTPLSLENTGLSGKVPNTEQTQKKHEKNTEQTPKIHRANTEQTQKNTNKNDKEYIKNEKNEKNEKKEKEGEENITQPPSIFFPTETHKKIFNLVGEVGYKTWFMESDIKQGEGFITIVAPNNFIMGVIRDRYLEKLKIELRENILLKES